MYLIGTCAQDQNYCGLLVNEFQSISFDTTVHVEDVHYC